MNTGSYIIALIALCITAAKYISYALDEINIKYFLNGIGQY